MLLGITGKMSGFAIVIIIVVLAIIIGNLMLLKHTAKFSLKNFNQDPIENAKKELERRKLEDSKTQKDHEQ